jgi:hypothetical protein
LAVSEGADALKVFDGLTAIGDQLGVKIFSAALQSTANQDEVVWIVINDQNCRFVFHSPRNLLSAERQPAVRRKYAGSDDAR